MIPPADSLLKYDNPALISKNTDRKSPKVIEILKKKTLVCLNYREWMENNQLWIQQVSSTPSTRMDVVHLQEELDIKLQQRQARETGICPVRRELYSQCFAYQTLYESSVAFGMRKALQAEQGKSDMEKRVGSFSNPIYLSFFTVKYSVKNKPMQSRIYLVDSIW
ncbi:hypothetical protein AB205_0115580 [Aquarana catesbeiana]|uniref:Axonemal dynein light intermediate polypeptide 1 n=1 Tax=Aquarana catesbeiana TaxID=8400 RepID=A0A2G9SFY7_AQUCT|nr:hypothetical protein AB205_0115580 [Aquarana catesbeiana]